MSTKLTITTPHLALFVAKRNSGMTHLQKFVLYTLAKGGRFRWVLVICPTAFTDDWGPPSAKKMYYLSSTPSSSKF